MGTPAFAVPTLQALVSAHEVVAVVTAPDRPAGRGQRMRTSAVSECAMALGIPVLRPERLKDPAFLEALDRLDASLYMVVAFRMLPEAVWSKPKLGTINLHASLLPHYRGAAPINWAIINGEQRSGLTTFLIRHAIDTGDILLQAPMEIGPDETAGDLHDRMMTAGADLVLRTVDGLVAGTLLPVAQHVDDPLPTAPKLNADNCRLGIGLSVQRAHDLVRGLSPHPGAWCLLHIGDAPPLHFKILRTKQARTWSGRAIPGSLHSDGERLALHCADGWLELLEVQAEGKRRMSTAEFLRGLSGRYASGAPSGMRLS